MALADGLQNYWACEEVADDRLDSHGSLTMIQHGTVPTGVGKQGSCCQFENDSTEYIQLADSQLAADDDFSVSWWMTFDTLQGSIYMSHSQTFAKGWYVDHTLAPVTNRTTFSCKTGGITRWNIFVDGQIKTTGTWYHVVVTAKNDVAREANLYIDGLLKASVVGRKVTDFATELGGTDKMTVGVRGDGGAPHDGKIDEIGYWNRPITLAEVQELYNSGDGLSYTGIVEGEPAEDTRAGTFVPFSQRMNVLQNSPIEIQNNLQVERDSTTMKDITIVFREEDE